MSDTTPPSLLTFEQVAAQLNVSERWLRHEVTQGRFPEYYRLGKKYGFRFSQEQIDAYLKSRTATATQGEQ